MQTNIYTLPELTFVGGKTQEMKFTLRERDGSLFNARNCVGSFAVCNYSNKSSNPLFTITPTFTKNGTEVIHMLNVTIPAEKTVGLYGKYIYQIIIKDDRGRVEIPNQGIMNITRNIHEDFI